MGLKMPEFDLQACLEQMINLLAEEQGQDRQEFITHPAEALAVWRCLVNTRPAQPATEVYLKLEEQFLRWFNQRDVKTLADCQQVDNRLYLYDGELTQLAVSAIVNPANSQLLGCFHPNHPCLDNAIHTFAGVDLRLACSRLMAEQGRKEAVGQAKLTAAYHLPAEWVIHTVGPFIPAGQAVSSLRATLLKQCYLSCLNLAAEKGFSSLALPCIATGQFGFPRELAAQIAIETVRDWQATNQIQLNLIFALYTEEDKTLYRRYLGITA